MRHPTDLVIHSSDNRTFGVSGDSPPFLGGFVFARGFLPEEEHVDETAPGMRLSFNELTNVQNSL